MPTRRLVAGGIPAAEITVARLRTAVMALYSPSPTSPKLRAIAIWPTKLSPKPMNVATSWTRAPRIRREPSPRPTEGGLGGVV